MTHFKFSLILQLLRELLGERVKGIIQVDVVRFYKGSLGVEVMMTTDENFEGDANTTLKALVDAEEDDHFEADSQDVQINVRSIVVDGTKMGSATYALLTVSNGNKIYQTAPPRHNISYKP